MVCKETEDATVFSSCKMMPPWNVWLSSQIIVLPKRPRRIKIGIVRLLTNLRSDSQSVAICSLRNIGMTLKSTQPQLNRSVSSYLQTGIHAAVLRVLWRKPTTFIMMMRQRKRIISNKPRATRNRSSLFPPRHAFPASIRSPLNFREL